MRQDISYFIIKSKTERERRDGERIAKSTLVINTKWKDNLNAARGNKRHVIADV